MQPTSKDASAQELQPRPAELDKIGNRRLRRNEDITLATDRFGNHVTCDRSGTYEQITIEAPEED